MAESNLTKKSNVHVTPREIDFVTRFSMNWQALQDILGISRPIRKEPGAEIRVVDATVALQSGAVAEGDVIPYSQAEVHERKIAEMNIEKYRKGVSIEAIQKHGYDVAVAKTDNALLNQLQNVIMGRFYNFLNLGALVDYQDTWQMALAMARGNVINLWKSMGLDMTEVVAFANVLDFHKYLGGANITIQTMFGMEYVQNFMGYRVIFLEDSSKIPQGTIIATPVENIVTYYVDPADSDFARAGLEYTTDGVTNLVGFHTEGNYGTAVSDCFAIMGFTLFAEYLNGIAVEKVVGSIPENVLTVKGDTNTSVLGKNVADLQSDIVVANNAFAGKVKYVTGFTGYSGDPAEQSGYFLATEIEADSGAVVTVELIGGTTGKVTLDSDMELVTRLTEGATALEFTSTVSGTTIIKRFDISKLIRVSE